MSLKLFHRSGHQDEFGIGAFHNWALGDLLSNSNRGVLAEFLVAQSVGAVDKPRQEWDEVDIRIPGGGTIEVKSTAYVQTWDQKKPSVAQFDFAPKKGWNAQIGEYSEEKLRRADIYVFCVLGSKEQPIVDPTDLDQWHFLVLPTSVLNSKIPNQKTITLGSLLRLSPVNVSFSDLSVVIRRLLDR
jgi:hypothetical protein